MPPTNVDKKNLKRIAKQTFDEYDRDRSGFLSYAEGYPAISKIF